MEELTEHVVSTAKRMEEYDDPFDALDDLNPLDIQATVSLGSDHVRDIELCVAMGGPSIWINVSKETVTGYWGSSEHTTHFNNEYIADELHRYLTERFEEQF